MEHKWENGAVFECWECNGEGPHNGPCTIINPSFAKPDNHCPFLSSDITAKWELKKIAPPPKIGEN